MTNYVGNCPGNAGLARTRLTRAQSAALMSHMDKCQSSEKLPPAEPRRPHEAEGSVCPAEHAALVRTHLPRIVRFAADAIQAAGFYRLASSVISTIPSGATV
jgi:hypothetical protein